MIDRTHELPFVRPCQIRALSRYPASYQPQSVSAADLELIRRMDPWNLEHLFGGENFLQHAPHTAIQLHTQMLLEFLGGHPLFALDDIIHRLYPEEQGGLRGLQDRPRPQANLKVGLLSVILLETQSVWDAAKLLAKDRTFCYR